ncbi:reversion-inducing cysteine-rich protein with Kazal motifs, partial [Tachysurus ichikawai]
KPGIRLLNPVCVSGVFLQIEACSKEAEKIDSLINSGSPTLSSHVPLSAFLTSELKLSTVSSAAAPRTSSICVSNCLSLCFLLTFLLSYLNNLNCRC